MAPTPTPRKRNTGRRVLLGVLGFCVLIALITALGSSPKKNTAAVTVRPAAVAATVPPAPPTTVPAPTTSTTQSVDSKATMVALQMAWQDYPKELQSQICGVWHKGNAAAAMAAVESPAAPLDFYEPQAVSDWFNYVCR